MTYESSARRDWRIWVMLLVGIMFAWAGMMADPATNCDDSGECAPWLVPIAMWLGIGLATIGVALLVVNPRRGSRVDATTGEITWWQNRSGLFAGTEGRIDPSQIEVVRIAARDSSKDEILLFDRNGERLHHFDAEVVGDAQGWAAQLLQQWPHIRLERR